LPAKLSLRDYGPVSLNASLIFRVGSILLLGPKRIKRFRSPRGGIESEDYFRQPHLTERLFNARLTNSTKKKGRRLSSLRPSCCPTAQMADCNSKSKVQFQAELETVWLSSKAA